MRREFSKRVRLEIIRRAMLPSGKLACEGCGLVLGAKRYEIDHTTPDGLQIDKSAPLTADDGKLLGKECCHTPKTASDVKQIAKSRRQEAKHYGIRLSRAPMPGSRASKFKRKLDGTVEMRR